MLTLIGCAGGTRFMFQQGIYCAASAKLRLPHEALAPALGASELVREMPANPQNEQAYDLFLRSVSIPYDPEPNKKATAMLEQSLQLDHRYPAGMAGALSSLLP